MYFKYILILLLLLNISFSFSQIPDTFGKITEEEKNMISYEKDSDANAVVLYERGDNYFKVINRRIRLVKEFHTKIKILDEKGFDEGTISILLRKNDKSTEKLSKIKAVTHNGDNQFNVLPSEIFEKDLNEYRIEKAFTFPKLQKGSILEYSYTIISPFFFNFRGWDFQSHIPKIYSEFNAEIPGNYIYNRALIGSLKLDINDSKLKKNCFHIDGFAQSADCEVIKYVMKNIPAFKIEEDYMLAPSNYISRLDFELSQHTRFDGITDRYTKSWEDVDREFRSDKDIGRQLSKTGFFENNVPEQLLTEGDALTRAKNIYAFVQKRFTWNEEYGIFGKARVKDAFENGKGNVSEINMSLINLLNAAGIKTNLMLLSTRKSGLPKKTHPIMNDFNYAIAKVEIDGKDYLLDATDKYIPFGMLPFRALNHYGRVMDFKNESYWYNIRPERDNKTQIRANLKFDVTQNKAIGIFDIVNTGYNAVNTLEELDSYDQAKYLESFEESIEGNLEINNYELKKNSNKPKLVSERFQFEIENELDAEMVYFNPFLIQFFNQNPFLLEERHYPVDFGYPRNFKYSINIGIPEGYAVHEIPEKKAVQLGDQLVIFQFLSQQNLNQVSFTFDLKLRSSYINPENYIGLKDLFKYVTDVQKNSLLVLKKI